VDIQFDIGLKRALNRDINLFGDEVIKNRYLNRYYPGQELYFKSCFPKRSADIIVDNNDPENPGILLKKE
jgi:uridine kinase